MICFHRLSWASSQPLLSQVLGKASEKAAAVIRRINLAFFSSLPLLSSLLARYTVDWIFDDYTILAGCSSSLYGLQQGTDLTTLTTLSTSHPALPFR